MINRRNLLSSLAGLIPVLAFIQPKKEECVVFPNGNKTFLLGNNRYRTEDVNGTIQWFYMGYLHREDGPAFIGHRISRPMHINIITGAIRPEMDDLGRAWFRHGLLHREDGPAIEMEDGESHWYINGLRHRIGGPASVYRGTESWWQNGKKHRTDGPAVTCKNGTKEWWCNGFEQTQQQVEGLYPLNDQYSIQQIC